MNVTQFIESCFVDFLSFMIKHFVVNQFIFIYCTSRYQKIFTGKTLVVSSFLFASQKFVFSSHEMVSPIYCFLFLTSQLVKNLPSSGYFEVTSHETLGKYRGFEGQGPFFPSGYLPATNSGQVKNSLKYCMQKKKKKLLTQISQISK